jgi:hypothetical protein
MALKKGAAMPIEFIVCFGVAIEGILGHIASRAIPILSQEKMIVIGHQTIGDRSDFVFTTILLHLVENKEIVIVFSKDRELTCSTIVEVIILAGKKWWSVRA